MIPAFIHTYDSRKVNKKVGVLKAQPSLYRLMKTLITKDRSPSFKMPALELPMVVPPRPWTSVTEGGYLISPGGWRKGQGFTHAYTFVLVTGYMLYYMNAKHFWGKAI